MSRASKLWIHGLVVVVISAVSDTGSLMLSSLVFAPGLLGNKQFWVALAGPIGFSALKMVFAYMKQSPIPFWGDDDTVVMVQSGPVGDATVTSVTTKEPNQQPEVKQDECK